MANPNISFYRQTTGSTAKGAITFDTTNKYIYLGDGSTAHKFDCNNTVYTHPTTAGNKHIPSGGSAGQILRWSSSGTATWGADNNTTYSGNSQYGITVQSNTIRRCMDYDAQSPTSFNGLNSNNGSLQKKLQRDLADFLNGRWSDSSESHLRLYITIHTFIQYSGWDSNTNYVTSTAIIDMPKMAYPSFDADSSDSSDSTYIFSTPFPVVSSVSGVSLGVLKLRFGGSSEFEQSSLSSITVVNATSLSTKLDSSGVVNGSYTIGYENCV